MVEAKVKEIMGTEVKVVTAIGNYLPAVHSGCCVYTSGQVPMRDGKLLAVGKVGKDVTPEQGYECARQCAYNCLGAIKAAIGNLEMIERVIKVVAFVNSAPGFSGQPAVANGASDFLVKVFGDAGKHARSAVGVAELPLNAPVEVEVVVSLKDKK